MNYFIRFLREFIHIMRNNPRINKVRQPQKNKVEFNMGRKIRNVLIKRIMFLNSEYVLRGLG